MVRTLERALRREGPMAAKVDVDAYRRFADNLRPVLQGKNIRTIGLKEARKMAVPFAVAAKTGSLCWRSAVSSRMAAKTVYLGSEAEDFAL